MSDNWTGYLAQVDGEPASIIVDIGLGGDWLRETYPNMAWVRLAMREPRPDGLPSSEEFDRLSEISDALEGCAVEGTSVFVGRNSGGGSQDYFFYTRDVPAFAELAQAAMEKFPDYAFETGGRPEPDWSTYFEFLYPTPADFQRIGNRQVLDSLRSNGDDGEAVRPIDHCALFQSEAARWRFASHIKAEGFEIADMLAPEDGETRFGLVFSREGQPAQIDSIVMPIWETVQEFDGEYDGWETAVIKPGPEG